jgi:RTX calcium-binding nonapeptide repeat (4 copies)
MNVHNPARLRGRTRRALVAALFALTALPAAANAATIEVFDNGSLDPQAFEFRAAPGERNDVRFTETADGSMIVSDSAPIRIVGESSVGSCRLDAGGAAICAPTMAPTNILLGDRDDVIRYFASEPVGSDEGFGDGVIDGADGNDTIFAGIRRNAVGVLDISGGAGSADKLTYASASSAATVVLDPTAGPLIGDDGVAGDQNHIRGGFEIVEGSAFDDTITGIDAGHTETFIGGFGNDQITGLGGPDVFDEGRSANGSDTLFGNSGIDLVDYSKRTRRVDVHMGDVVRNDGEAGEFDFVDPNVNDALGGSAGDFLTGGSGANALTGNGGGDTIAGNGGDDRVTGGTGEDLLTGGAENDTIDSVDNEPDRIRCHEGDRDTLTRDLRDVDATGCENVNSVGVLELAPKALAAEAGERVRLRMRWTHPQSWRKLRSISLRLRARDAVVGGVTIRPRGERIAAAGAVALVRKQTRLSHKGKWVSARLAIRLDDSLAGQTLKAEVEATDTRGRRQLERDAGTIRVAG